MAHHIVILDGHAANPGDLDWSQLEALAPLTVYDRTAPEDTVTRIGKADIVLTNKTRLTAEIIHACPSIRYIGLLATGYNVVDLDAARARGIPVCNVPAYSTDAVAQHVFALLLELTNMVGHHNAAVQSGRWISSRDFCFWDGSLMELRGKTMGIIGYGQIGQAVARIAEAFGMRVLATARHNRPGLVSLDQVLTESDIITLHCPLFADNTGMISRETLARMKNGVLLINTARGPLIDESALREALLSGKVGGAAMDVVSAEPMAADCPLLGLENCIITPHIAWAPIETRSRLLTIAADNVRGFLAGQVIHDVT